MNESTTRTSKQYSGCASFQILDVDMSGLPCGSKAAFATKGYFAKQRNRRGRQLGRVLATIYQEAVHASFSITLEAVDKWRARYRGSPVLLGICIDRYIKRLLFPLATH